MIKHIILVLLCLIAGNAFPQEEVAILLDGQEFMVETNKEFTYKTLSGDSVKFTIVGGISAPVAQPVKVVEQVRSTSVATSKGNYKDEFLSFNTPENLAMTKTSLWAGIDQLSFSSGLGSGLMIYQYAAFDPTSLGNHLLQDMLSAYDEGDIQTETTAIQVGKKKARGKKATIHTTTGTELVEVYAYPSGKGGLLITIFHANANAPDNSIEEFLSSIKVY